MKTAVILGSGPEIDYFFSVSEKERKNLVCFSTDASPRFPTEHASKVGVLNLLEIDEGIRIMRAQDISKIVTIGSMKVNSTFLHARTPAARRQLRTFAFAYLFQKTNIAESYFQKLNSFFEFPPVKSVLPFLFATGEVAINAAPEVLARALAELTSERTDYEMKVGDNNVKMFRIKRGESTALVNRRLFLEKIQESHRDRGVTHYFFDIDRTIIVNLDKIVQYARENNITLQSFREPDEVASC